MTTVFLLPGWQDSGPSHWQSRWETQHGYTRVQQHDWQRPLRGDWQAHLDEVIANHLAAPATLLNSELFTLPFKGLQPDLAHENAMTTGVNQRLAKQSCASIVLVAHSLGCHLVAAWVHASRHASVVRGALLVAPPDVTRDDLSPDLYNWRRPVLNPLPFPATCIVSSDDPFASLDAGRSMAAAWGARCIELGAFGHINGDSGLGDWPQGQARLAELRGPQRQRVNSGPYGH